MLGAHVLLDIVEDRPVLIIELEATAARFSSRWATEVLPVISSIRS